MLLCVSLSGLCLPLRYNVTMVLPVNVPLLPVILDAALELLLVTLLLTPLVTLLPTATGPAIQ